MVHLPSASVEAPLPSLELGVTLARGSGCPVRAFTTVPSAAQSEGWVCGRGRAAGFCAASVAAASRQVIVARMSDDFPENLKSILSAF